MKNKINLPAFPSGTSEGLTKREYFTAMALIGLEASNGDFYPASDIHSLRETARQAVKLADFVLEELNKSEETEEVKKESEGV